MNESYQYYAQLQNYLVTFKNQLSMLNMDPQETSIVQEAWSNLYSLIGQQIKEIQDENRYK